MAVFSMKVQNKEGKTLCVSGGEDFVSLVHTAEYQEGDFINLQCSEKNRYVILQVDDALGSSLCFLTDSFYYHVPFGEQRISYSPKAFYGNRHYLYARMATEEEIYAYRNLAFNVNDQHGDTHCYPHATANVETRGEAVFAARNAIDGVCENRSHGEWPYESWGINRRDDAEMTVELGQKAEIDKIILFTRADFPHDNWWKQVTFEFSDGNTLVQELEKSVKPHVITFEKRTVEWVKLCNLIKADDPSPFPALTQIEIYGRICRN